MEQQAINLLKKINAVSSVGADIIHEKKIATQVQQNSSVKEKLLAESRHQHFDELQKSDFSSMLCISKKEYETIVRKRPLIKFRPLKNSFIKSGDKRLLADSLSISVSEVDNVIDETLDYLIYYDPVSIYYDPDKILSITYMDEKLKKNMLEDEMINEADKKARELQYYKEQGDVIGPYVYRHGSKEQLLNYMKLQLSDAKSVLSQLYNILDVECGPLYSYFERPIHVLDNRTVMKMHNIVKTGLKESKNQGYITEECCSEKIKWVLEKIYAIQTNTSLRAALKTVGSN